MKEQQAMQFRLMTYNIGGGRKDFGSVPEDVIEVIREVSPDILAVQEATKWQDADGIWHSTASMIAEAMGFGKEFHFGPTLSMREHMHVKKAIFVHAIFSDWKDWIQGNAVFSRWRFVRLGDASRRGGARNVPLYKVPLYGGNRDTDPRHALLARINRAPIFPLLIGLHLTTLVGERTKRKLEDLSKSERAQLLIKSEEAELLRYEQARRLLDLLRHHALNRGEVIFLLGDFNAVAGEACISTVLETEGGFVRLIPSNAQNSTHPKTAEPVDHIFVYPRNRIIDYRCWIVENDTAQQASDHLPVVADVRVSFS